MAANPFLGVFLHSVGGLAAGSFYVPFRKVRQWAWESYWLIQGVAAWVVMPTLMASVTTPRLWDALTACDCGCLALVYLFGALWGVGGLTFGLSMRYLGLSLGYAISLGFCMTFGTLLPPIVHGRGSELVSSVPGLILVGGVLVCLAGITLCGYAGLRKERELTEEQKRETLKEFSLLKGFAVAVFAGVMSACMAFAIDAGKPIAAAALEAGSKDIFKNNPVYIIAMAGGFTTNFVWCLILNLKNRSLRNYVSGGGASLGANYLFAALAGIIWYGQFFFYGMGTTQMGRFDFSSWTIHMAFIIVFSTLWGIYFSEWKGVRRATWAAVLGGILVLILSTIVIGWGNTLAEEAAGKTPAKAEQACLERP